ncbi:MAG: carbon-nitrogen hydrolase [Lentisphaeria bacterium]|nr:carbon-nitrogen hydrolase [Lentisphaeria bacterium]
MSLPTVRIGLLQDRDRGGMSAAAAQTEQLIRQAAAGGAQVICTQELFLTEYFCWKQDSSFFDLAVPVPSEWTDRFCRLAEELSVVLVLSLFERRAPGLCHNTAVVIDADGTLLGKYRKMHIPQDPGFEEKFYFAPGDLPYRSFHTRYADIGVLVCWDQWYPEAARLTALAGAQIIFCPTAIGGIASEPESLGGLQRDAWLNVQRGHAVANGCFFAAVNRVGTEHGTKFWGSSFAADFYGNHLALGSRDREEILYADCDLAAMEEHRRMWPFFRDRRIDSYGPIMRRFDD